MKQVSSKGIFIKCNLGAIQVLRNAVGEGGWCPISRKKRYEGRRFNVIRVTMGWVPGWISNFQEKR